MKLKKQYTFARLAQAVRFMGGLGIPRIIGSILFVLAIAAFPILIGCVLTGKFTIISTPIYGTVAAWVSAITALVIATGLGYWQISVGLKRHAGELLLQWAKERKPTWDTGIRFMQALQKNPPELGPMLLRPEVIWENASSLPEKATVPSGLEGELDAALNASAAAGNGKTNLPSGVIAKEQIAAIRTLATSYLNLLEVVLFSWKHKTANRAMIEEEFVPLFEWTPVLQYLGDFSPPHPARMPYQLPFYPATKQFLREMIRLDKLTDHRSREGTQLCPNESPPSVTIRRYRRKCFTQLELFVLDTGNLRTPLVPRRCRIRRPAKKSP